MNRVTHGLMVILVNFSLCVSMVLSPLTPLFSVEAASIEVEVETSDTIAAIPAENESLAIQELPPYTSPTACWVQHWNGQGHTEWQITNPNNVPLVSQPDTKLRYNWRVYDAPNASGNILQTA